MQLLKRTSPSKLKEEESIQRIGLISNGLHVSRMAAGYALHGLHRDIRKG